MSDYEIIYYLDSNTDVDLFTALVTQEYLPDQGTDFLGFPAEDEYLLKIDESFNSSGSDYFWSQRLRVDLVKRTWIPNLLDIEDAYLIAKTEKDGNHVQVVNTISSLELYMTLFIIDDLERFPLRVKISVINNYFVEIHGQFLDAGIRDRIISLIFGPDAVARHLSNRCT